MNLKITDYKGTNISIILDRDFNIAAFLLLVSYVGSKLELEIDTEKQDSEEFKAIVFAIFFLLVRGGDSPKANPDMAAIFKIGEKEYTLKLSVVRGGLDKVNFKSMRLIIKGLAQEIFSYIKSNNIVPILAENQSVTDDSKYYYFVGAETLAHCPDVVKKLLIARYKDLEDNKGK